MRPLAVSTDGSRLFALNTPDNRLEIFSISNTLTPLYSVPVGLEPVALAEDPQGRVWVVNHLSDSISVVDVEALPPRVLNTLWVGDEPRDIVFAGEQRERAFITTAHRGQNSPVDPAMNTASVGRADVWVFDSESLDQTPGGQVLSIITLFGDRPRPLAVSPDGLTVYAGIFLSGNRTTVLSPNNIPKAAPITTYSLSMLLPWRNPVGFQGSARYCSILQSTRSAVRCMSRICSRGITFVFPA